MGIVVYWASHIARSQTGHSQNGLQPNYLSIFAMRYPVKEKHNDPNLLLSDFQFCIQPLKFSDLIGFSF